MKRSSVNGGLGRLGLPQARTALWFSYVFHYAAGTLAALPIAALWQSAPSSADLPALARRSPFSALGQEVLRSVRPGIGVQLQVSAALFCAFALASLVPLSGLVGALKDDRPRSISSWLRRSSQELLPQTRLSALGLLLSALLIGFALGLTQLLDWLFSARVPAPLSIQLGLLFKVLCFMPAVMFQATLGVSRFCGNRTATTVQRLLDGIAVANRAPAKLFGAYALTRAASLLAFVALEAGVRLTDSVVLSLLLHALGLLLLELGNAVWLGLARGLSANKAVKPGGP